MKGTPSSTGGTPESRAVRYARQEPTSLPQRDPSSSRRRADRLAGSVVDQRAPVGRAHLDVALPERRTHTSEVDADTTTIPRRVHKDKYATLPRTSEEERVFTDSDDTTRQKHPQATEFALPASKDELDIFCISKMPVYPDVSLVPGAYANAPDDLKRKLNGEYGVELTGAKTGETLGRAGFDVDTRRHNRIFIGHSPQGSHKDNLTHDGRREALVSNFRVRLVDGIVNVAKGLGVDEVVGYSADTHPGVQAGLFPYERAKAVMDDVYTAAGFTKDPVDKNYHKRV